LSLRRQIGKWGWGWGWGWGCATPDLVISIEAEWLQSYVRNLTLLYVLNISSGVLVLKEALY
jgi:hypothetical protein